MDTLITVLAGVFAVSGLVFITYRSIRNYGVASTCFAATLLLGAAWVLMYGFEAYDPTIPEYVIRMISDHWSGAAHWPWNFSKTTDIVRAAALVMLGLCVLMSIVRYVQGRRAERPKA